MLLSGEIFYLVYVMQFQICRKIFTLMYVFSSMVMYTQLLCIMLSRINDNDDGREEGEKGECMQAEDAWSLNNIYSLCIYLNLRLQIRTKRPN